MKRIITMCATLLVSASMFAQAPVKMSYQAVVRDGSNNLVTSNAVGMQISILQGSSSGTAVYVETQNPTTNTNGLVSIEIGIGSVVSGDFSTINWANDTYFIKTESDPAGGTNYTITGTSQFLSVPYALHAMTAGSIAGGINETDPIYAASVASEINATDTTSWNNKLDSYSETDPIYAASVASEITAADTTTWNNKLDSYSETDPSVPAGTQTGEMQYWDGSNWVTLVPGLNDATLKLVNGIPTWIGGISTVLSPLTGKTWMDKNLGALQVATSSTDANAYGDLYQWGRGTDGHEKRSSGSTNTLSSTDQPGHGDFIISPNSPFDWLSPKNDNLWQGVNGVNNPCPSGYRLPTDTEFDAERQSWSTQDAAGAFDSPLKLPLNGYRSSGLAALTNADFYGYYWTSTINGNGSNTLTYGTSLNDSFIGFSSRGNGYGVRCIKD